jgi:uncharacterized membrane protein
MSRLLDARCGPFFLIVLLAFLWRLLHLGAAGYWNDEILTLENSAKPWPAMLQSLQAEESNKPPLYYLFMRAWLHLGHGETIARLPSALFGALTCGVVFLIAGELLEDRLTAVLAGFFLVFAPLHLTYSQEVRMYALWVLETAIALWALLAWFRTRAPVHLFLFAAAALMAEYTFSYGFFFLGLAGLMVACEWPRLGPRRGALLLAVIALVFLTFVPWLLRLVEESGRPEAVMQAKGPPWSALAYTVYVLGYGFDLGPSLNDLQVERAHYFVVHPAQTLIVLVSGAALLALMARGVIALRGHRLALVVTVGGLLIFLLPPAAISLLKPVLTDNPRYALPALIPATLLIVAGGRAFAQGRILGRGICILFGLGWLVALGNYEQNPAYQREDLRGATEAVSEMNPPPAAILVCAGHLERVVNYYDHGPAPRLAITIPAPEDFAGQIAAIEPRLPASGRLVLIYARPDIGDAHDQLRPWLRARYRQAGQLEFNHAEVDVFER